MKNTIHKIYNKVGIKSDRTKNITKHVLLSFVYKGGSILASFLLVPLTINYLDTENYGIWLTLSSFIAWFSFFDIGLGNGLRNKFAEAKAKGDMTLARGYVSSAYFTIGAVSLGLILIFTALNVFIDWTKVFNASSSLQKDLSLLMPIVFGFFCLQMVVKLITTIYTADQHHSMQGKINFFIQAGSLLLIWIMTKTSESSLLIFGTIFSIFPVVILIGLNWLAFNKRYQEFSPSLKLWKKEYLNDIFGLGTKFFIIQIAAVVIYQTTNMIISHVSGPADVTVYNVAFKYFSSVTMVFAIILTPFWSAFTEAKERVDYEWMGNAYKNLFRIVLILIGFIAFLLLIADYMYELWIGAYLSVSFAISVAVAVSVAINLWNMLYSQLLNGMGKIKLQLYVSVIGTVLNVPLAMYLGGKYGVAGVVFSSILLNLISALYGPYQVKLLLNKRAKGIWDA